MDGECAFCGRADGATYPVFCRDCQAQHRVCRQCLAEAAPEAATLGLELDTPQELPQAA
jgi:ribosomal protein S14